MDAHNSSATVQQPTGDASSLPEIDVSSIVRPERIIAPEVSGLAVAMMSGLAGKPKGRYALYLRWTDGKRESRALGHALDMPDGRPLWIHPQPCEPSAANVAGWSRPRRMAWLAGAAAPRPEEVFRRVCERIAQFLDLPAEKAAGITAMLALWVLLSYAYPAWPAVPYLYVGGPLGSGKSRVFDILWRLVFRPLSSSNLTAPALFRTLHNQGGVLLFDEAERLRQTQSPEVQELLSMLLAGYRRGGQATRLEKEKNGSFRTVAFDVYSPKALACITGLPPALASRCISITMFRAAKDSEKTRRRIDADPVEWQSLRDDLHALALEHGADWLKLVERTDVCPNMSGRDFELWQPIIALAAWIEEHGADGLTDIIRQYALASIVEAEDDAAPDADATILRMLAAAVTSGRSPTAKELLDDAQLEDPTAFKLWSPRGIAGRLKLYGVPKPRKAACGSRKQYSDVTPDLLRRIEERYGIDLGLA